jgi:hypothetical protein
VTSARSSEGGGLSAQQSASVSAIVFAVVLVVGAAFIVVAKSVGVSTLWTTIVPLLLISSYAVLLAFARYLHLRDDQAGDNLYYLGFLYTLTSLGVSLWQFSSSGGADAVVTNFGVAVSSTILGVALRVMFGQMRQDPLEVERTARLELADAARRVRHELDETVFELSSFRRATQQSITEGVLETKKQIELISSTIVGALEDLPKRSAAPFEGASKQASEAFTKLSDTLRTVLEQNGAAIERETSQLASTASEVRGAIKTVQDQLKGMQSPDGIIEIKLQPTIRSMTKALKDLSERLGTQVEQLQSAVNAATVATQEASANAKADAEQHNQSLLRVIAALTDSQNSIQQMLATQQRWQTETQQRWQTEMKIQGALPLTQPAERPVTPPRTFSPPRQSSAPIPEADAARSRWPWGRR